MFFQEGFEHGFWPMEIGSFPFFYRLTEINQAMFRCQIKKSERAGDAQASAASYATTIALIDQQQVGVKGFRQRDSGGFTFIKPRYPGQASRVVDFEPRGWCGDPSSYWKGRMRGE